VLLITTLSMLHANFSGKSSIPIALELRKFRDKLMLRSAMVVDN